MYNYSVMACGHLWYLYYVLLVWCLYKRMCGHMGSSRYTLM